MRSGLVKSHLKIPAHPILLIRICQRAGLQCRSVLICILYVSLEINEYYDFYIHYTTVETYTYDTYDTYDSCNDA